MVGTHIPEITIPNSVKNIDSQAFAGINELVKITILDNVTEFGNDVFSGHNEELTIYCYEGSAAAKYAIDNNIKYVYLERNKPSSNPENEDNPIEQPEIGLKDIVQQGNKLDTTTAKGILPQTGTGTVIITLFVAIVIVAVVFYKKYYKYKDIK